MSVVIVLSWYLCGAWAAAWMVHRGHSATPWWVGASLLGGMLWAFAFPCARLSGEGVRWTGDAPDVRPHGRLVVGLLDEVGDVGGTAASIARGDDHLVMIHRVGREAASSLVETGEQAVASDRFQTAQRRWPGTTHLRVGSGPAGALVAEATPARGPDLVVRGATTGWAWRHSLRRSVALGSIIGCPVLHAPSATADDWQLVARTARNA